MRRRGYILVETLVAMAVLSVSLLGIHRGISQALTARARTMDFTVARFLMDEKLGELMLQPELVKSSGQGRFDAPHERFSYAWSVTKIDVPRPEIPNNLPQERRDYLDALFKTYLGKITVTIKWDRSGQKFERTGETLIGPDKLWVPPKPGRALPPPTPQLGLGQ